MMPPYLKTALKWVIALTAMVAGLQPFFQAGTGIIPASALAKILGVVAAAGTLHSFLAESPMVLPLLATKAKNIAVVVMCLALGGSAVTSSTACTKQQGQAIVADLTTLEPVALSALQCAISDALSGVTSAAAIGLQCGIPAGFDLVSFLGGLADKLLAGVPDGGVGTMMHGDMVTVIAKLRAVH